MTKTLRTLATMNGMLLHDAGWLNSIRSMMNQNYSRGSLNFHQSQFWRGRKKTLHGFGYIPKTQMADGHEFKIYPDKTAYLKTKSGALIKVLPVDKGKMILGSKNIKQYLRMRREIARNKRLATAEGK